MFWVFGMTGPVIEPWSTGPSANSLSKNETKQNKIKNAKLIKKNQAPPPEKQISL